jgi:Peptidase family M1 domain
MDIDGAAGRVDGMLRIRFTPDLRTDRLVFRLWPNGPREDGGAELTMLNVRVDGERAELTERDPSMVTARTGTRFASEVPVDISLEWHLSLPTSVKDRISQTGDAISLGSFFPLLPWAPGVGWITDAPIESLGEASISPIADFDVRIRGVPDGSVIASGTRVGPGHWRAEAVRDFALATGDFERSTATVNAPDRVRVIVGVHDGIGPPAERFASQVTRALDLLSERFGPYPWDTLNMAIVPGLGSAGIEYPTMIFQGDESLLFATTHEVGHQWFYSLVGSNPARHPWMDESLAMWSNAISDDIMDFIERAEIPPDVEGRLGQPMSFWDQHQEAYFLGVYVQGVRALAALGPPAKVDCALKRYVAAHAYGIAEPADLLDALDDRIPGARATLGDFGV